MLLSDIYLWLSYSQVDTRKLNKLLSVIPPDELWESFGGRSARFSLDDKTLGLLERSHNVEFIERAKHYLAANNIEYVTRADPIFPVGLAQSEVDPPLVLYYKGDINLVREKCVAVVGTRHSSPYGKFATEKIVSELCENGITIVSGLATGIDGFAHRAALGQGGKTIAVLGSGLFNMTPTSNVGLFDKICKDGLVMSEYTPDVHASVYTFPRRNRIISGLSSGVLVVEAAEKSGSLITANCALEQGRDVFAVPGDIDRPNSVGTNKLIKQGAVPVTCVRDILDFYGITGKTSKKATPELDMFERRVIEVLGEGEASFDTLVERVGISPSELNTALSTLIILGLIHEKSKNIYTVKQP